MSRLFFAAVSIIPLVAVAAPASAQHFRNGYGLNDRYCLTGKQWGYPGNCQFATFAQCKATASGTDADCNINPAFAFAQQR